LRVAYLGPAGTFAEEALRASAPIEGAGAPGTAIEELPHATIFEAVMAVQAGTVDRAVVPIENSIEGSVNATLDALAHEATDVRIVAEVDHRIHQTLIASNGVVIGDVTRVLSHPQATAQSSRFLAEQLPDAAIESTTSTAEGVRIVAGSSEPWAAIGPRLAADLYGASVLAERIEDHPDNMTRFVWLAPAGTEPAQAPTKTSVVFWGFNDRSPGALVRVLGEFAEREINLTKIESRPRRVGLGHYMFFADCDGAAGDPAVAGALDALRDRVEVLRVLGSYAAAVTGA
jgi:prephenate dehydratase